VFLFRHAHDVFSATDIKKNTAPAMASSARRTALVWQRDGGRHWNLACLVRGWG